ncbi:alkaline phosphatase PHO8 Ecym_2551 [Eremothecium cymbalariae DBVPG|uniref:Alkaline phosphatase n=1 Tax=Eremothecium cymbalariae (strain CBS 270.75 / DBVPG 7215 / KCTC 17166 / NRRL Y-17582) TaxID=931890 RepID=G8JQB3_ERECY|nr:Hypothetical protein Ecym_2551 [Eremothecium cymbalariae DBVPG\
MLEKGNDYYVADIEANSLVPKKARKRWLVAMKWVVFCIVLRCVFWFAFDYDFMGRYQEAGSKRNVIFFVTDGMGPASLTLTRGFLQNEKNDTTEMYFSGLGVNSYLVGTSRTRSSSSYITDSAAGATAFSCGLKTYNGAVGVDAAQQPCGTVLEAAKLQGYMTGMVVTTRITDATPGAYSAHVDNRGQEELIAEQQLGGYPLGRVVDLIIGGGRKFFFGSNERKYGGEYGARRDERDLIEEAVVNGWQYVGDTAQFRELQGGKNVSLPLLALLAHEDLPYSIDRDAERQDWPSFTEQVKTAVRALTEATKDSDKGFFLLVEASRIDHAGHTNDPGTQAREVMGFDDAFQWTVAHAKNSNVETLIISTSDHETGGLSVGRQLDQNEIQYYWDPEVLSRMKHSCDYFGKEIMSFKESNADPAQLREFVRETVFKDGLGIRDVADSDVNLIVGLDDFAQLVNELGLIVSVRAYIGWSTHGHSGVDVNVYAYANKMSAKHLIRKNLSGNRENTDIGQFVIDYLSLDVAAVTDMLKDTKHSPDKGN